MSIAKIIEQKSHLVPGKLKITEYLFEVPENYTKASGDAVRLFARSAEKYDKAVGQAKEKEKFTPWMCYLQGGPGMGCRPPQSSGWVKTALGKGYKVLMMDQRGTGLSTTLTARSIAHRGNLEAQIDYVSRFRADSIVKDAEAIRVALTADYPEDEKKWSIIGQSFGGFCSVTYLSKFPQGLREVFTLGGLPPLVKQPDVVYERLARRVAERSRQYYEKFPEDVKRVKEIAKYLEENDIKTMTGGRVSVDRLRSFGLFLGFHGRVDSVHYLFYRMWNDLEMFGYLSRPTISAFDSMGAFDDTIIYAILHEPIYCQGAASEWSADRLLSKKPEFEQKLMGDEPLLFTAEMIKKSFFEDYDELRSLYPLADALAKKGDWDDLYDEEKLAKNDVPVYSATYYDDLYVDFDFAQETAKKIKGCKVFLTNTMWHDAIGSKTDEVMGELFKLRDDVLY